MLRKYSAGQFVPGGVYWNTKAWELVAIAEDGDYLPAGEGITHYQVPVPLVLALGPLAGLIFILILPLLVPFLALYAAGRVITKHIPRGAASGEGSEVSASH